MDVEAKPRLKREHAGFNDAWTARERVRGRKAQSTGARAPAFASLGAKVKRGTPSL